MVKIIVGRDGACRVRVRGDWDVVRRDMQTAADSIRQMALDSREFAATATAELPMRLPKRRTESALPPYAQGEEGYRIAAGKQEHTRPAVQPGGGAPPHTTRERGSDRLGGNGGGSPQGGGYGTDQYGTGRSPSREMCGA